MTTSLASLGWSEFFQEQRDRDPALLPMRVAIEHQDRYTLIGETDQRDAHLTGRLLQEANQGGPRPAVGDWVGVNETGAISYLFERKTAFQRTSPRGKLQVIAANIDLVLIVTSCNAEFNLRRIERYLSAVSQSGASAAVVLSKVDLCADPARYLEPLAEVVGRTPVFPVATPSGTGLDALRPLLDRGKTLALVGSSGVGKSTLANALLGIDLFETAAIREQDAKGRHTTTRRELVVLSQERGILIDTPGMRELQISGEDRGLEEAFEDVQALAQSCRFRDCRHLKEPGCAVRGVIDPLRLKNYQIITAEQGKSRGVQQRTQRAVHRGSTRGSKKGKSKS